MTNINNKSFSSYVKTFAKFATLLRVEPFLLSFTMISAMYQIPVMQMVQDKICRSTYGLNATYCGRLPGMKPWEDVLNVKSKVLVDTQELVTYTQIILTVPSLFISLFVGSWFDRYIHAKKIMMIAGSLSFALQCLILVILDYYFVSDPYLLLLSMVPALGLGGMFVTMSAMYAYISTTTPPHMRSLRLTATEIVSSVGHPIALWLGGVALNTQSWFSSGQHLNYSAVFVVGVGIGVFGMIWTLLMVNEEKDIMRWEEAFGSVVDDGITSDGTDSVVVKKLKSFEDNKHIHPLKLLFDFKNVKEVIVTCCKPRANYVRIQIWVLFVSILCSQLAHSAPAYFLMQFAQRVYNWDSSQFSNASAYAQIAVGVGTLIITPMLIKVFKIKDTILSMIGLVAYSAQNLIRAFVLTPNGFYYSLIPGTFGNMSNIGIRAHFSKIVKPDELGKVFTCMGGIEAIVPLFGSFMFQQIFAQTVDTMPGASLLFVAVVLIIPFAVVFWINFYTVLPDSLPINNSENKTGNYGTNGTVGNDHLDSLEP